MLKNRLFVFGIVILLVFSSIVVIDSVDAREGLEDNDKIEPNPYLYIYTNSPDASETNFDPPEYDFPDDPPTPVYETTAYSGESQDETFDKIDSWLSLSVTPYKISGCDYQQNIHFAVHVVGYSEYEEEDEYTEITKWNPHILELEAEQSDVNANLHYKEEYNSGINTGGDTGEGIDVPSWAETLYNGASVLPVIGDFQDYGELGYSIFSSHMPTEVKEYDNSDSGPNAKLESECYVNKAEKDFVEDEGQYFSFSTELMWELKEEKVDLSQSHNLEISTSLITEKFHVGDELYPSYDYEEGPEASVEITIKQRELDISTTGSGWTDPSTGTHNYPEGEEVDISAHASQGWEFKEWTGDTEAIENPTSSNTQITIEDDYEITAEFEEIYDTCPICGGIIGHCDCGITSHEHEACLERSEYEEYLEEGQIAPELLEALVEEGIDDLGKEAELSQAEEGWFIEQDSEKRY